MTWMMSMRMCTVMSRVAASAPILSIWWLAPSTSATQVRVLSGSRRVASSNTSVMTIAASWTTLAVSHLPVAVGPSVAAARSASVAGRMSATVRMTGGCVVNRADLGHALAVTLLSLAQAAREFR